jgi:hypothetical protein
VRFRPFRWNCGVSSTPKATKSGPSATVRMGVANRMTALTPQQSACIGRIQDHRSPIHCPHIRFMQQGRLDHVPAESPITRTEIGTQCDPPQVIALLEPLPKP